MRGFSLKLSIAALLLQGLIGCVSTVDVQALLNQSIGESIAVFRGGQPTEVRSVGPAVDEYLYDSNQTGCRVALTVDKQTKIIKGWRYLSDPELCRVKHEFGHPW